MKQKDQLSSRCDQSVIIKNLRDLTAIKSKHAAMMFSVHGSDQNMNKSKEIDDSFKTVMFLSCWGPN